LGRSVNLSKENVISALCLGAFGIYVISVAANLAYVSDVGPGPGFFPLWLGVGLIVFAACLIFVAPNAENRETARPAFSKTAGRALAGWVALMVAIALLGRIGFILSFVALAVFLIVVLDRRPALLAIIVAIGLAAAFQLIFVAALDVALPTGFWGF
jgi:putative tricarboxylic transport membrane protein